MTVRPATSDDVEAIVALIEALADYERLATECFADTGRLREHLFGERPSAEALVGEAGGSVAGFALFFTTYSTFLTRPGIWLEDLFVLPEHRGAGLGRALIGSVAGIAADRGCGRMEWSVLDWNEPAMGFYRGLGARLVDDWRICRLDGKALASLGRR